MSEQPHQLRGKQLRLYDRFFQAGLIALPYLTYLGLVGIGVALIYLLITFRRSRLDSFTRNGLLLISGLMVLSGLFAFDRGEAFLQLTNYLPFFLLFAFLPYLLRGAERLEELAFSMVVTAIPLNLMALGDYLLRAGWIPRQIRRVPFVKWIRSRPHEGRALATFGHPNALAAYLVILFGLGLGLIVCHNLRRQAIARPRRFSYPAWLYCGTFINLLGIFCSGSRNGLLVAVSQLVLFGIFTKASRAIVLGGLLGIGGLGVGVTWLGVGGRSQWGNWTDESRLVIWRIALDLIRERPLLGWGLGNYKFLYPSRIVGLNLQETYVGHPHNLWLMLGCEGGIVLMFAFSLWVGYLCFRGVKALILQQLKPIDRAVLLGYLAAFWGCVAFAFFDVPIFDARLNVMGWVLLAGIYTLVSDASDPSSNMMSKNENRGVIDQDE
ncbi:MAG: O-antigen ligase family protein [Drouetiella hepatica Uher 2000/2452]|uniref:O-antigen ligase family protein n=1 Tax=Drouetiella hepatica Uher 2000/2452 TaxID=904376 RepID=A0A951Q8K7_9CYAN|nr:O-antigen ligase family protein [Drouetiella hepatica Uher 2000/2452]